jgi:hypothetical protein
VSDQIGYPTRRTARGDRVVEILAVILLGISTVGSAWCGYQASRWNGEQGDLSRQASDLDIEANRLTGIGVQQVAYDAGLLADYAQAVATDQDRLAEFYRSSLVRPQFLPLLEEWEDEVAAGRAPDNLFEDEDYLADQFGPAFDIQAESEAVTVDSQAAGRTADSYVLTTLFFAVALFFSGVTSSFRTRGIRIVLLMGASLTVAFALARVAELPVT